jgi:hypothetical protein
MGLKIVWLENVVLLCSWLRWINIFMGCCCWVLHKQKMMNLLLEYLPACWSGRSPCAGRGYSGIGWITWQVMVHNLLTSACSQHTWFSQWRIVVCFGKGEGCTESRRVSNWWKKLAIVNRCANLGAAGICKHWQWHRLLHVTSLPIIHPGFSQLCRSKLQQVLTTSISPTYHINCKRKSLCSCENWLDGFAHSILRICCYF